MTKNDHWYDVAVKLKDEKDIQNQYFGLEIITFFQGQKINLEMKL